MNNLDRRSFLTKAGILAAVPVLVGVVGFNPLQSTAYNGELGSRLYVNFENPRVGQFINMVLPFRGRFRGIRGLAPEDSALSVSGETGILVSDQTVEAESQITVTILDCTKGIKMLEGVIVMEKI